MAEQTVLLLVGAHPTDSNQLHVGISAAGAFTSEDSNSTKTPVHSEIAMSRIRRGSSVTSMLTSKLQMISNGASARQSSSKYSDLDRKVMYANPE